MKHGDKEKGKASKASGKKASSGKEAGAKSSKASSLKSKSSSAAEKASPKTSTKAPAGNGGAAGRNEDVRFTNATVGNAFKRAVKKYPNAFKRLTD